MRFHDENGEEMNAEAIRQKAIKDPMFFVEHMLGVKLNDAQEFMWSDLEKFWDQRQKVRIERPRK